MGIFYSSDALAAKINGYDDFTPDANGNIVITEDEQLAAGSHHFVIAQGDKLVIATEGNVNSLITGIKTALENDKLEGTMAKLNAIREVLAENSVVGVVGGEGQLETGIKKIINLEFIKGLIDSKLGTGFVDEIINIDTLMVNLILIKVHI